MWECPGGAGRRGAHPNNGPSPGDVPSVNMQKQKKQKTGHKIVASGKQETGPGFFFGWRGPYPNGGVQPAPVSTQQPPARLLTPPHGRRNKVWAAGLSRKYFGESPKFFLEKGLENGQKIFENFFPPVSPQIYGRSILTLDFAFFASSQSTESPHPLHATPWGYGQQLFLAGLRDLPPVSSRIPCDRATDQNGVGWREGSPPPHRPILAVARTNRLLMLSIQSLDQCPHQGPKAQGTHRCYCKPPQ